MDIWLEEFLFRGRPPIGPGSELPSEFHIMIGQQAPSAFNQEEFERRLMGPLTPEEVAALGLSLPDILEQIDTAALNELLLLRVERDALKAQIAALADVDMIRRERDIIRSALQGDSAALAQAYEETRAALVAVTAERDALIAAQDAT